MMELKVWSEGIPRVISGVTETTTCQDVVIALAQASGKTGRYTLVEKWRDIERFVAPDENPVLALTRWGEYASDVQFILKHSDDVSKVNGHSGSGPGADNKWTKELPQHNFAPRISNSRSSSTSSLRKSLTFSGAHSKSHLVSRTRRRDKDGSLNDNSSLESLTEKSSLASQSSRSTFMHSSPYSSIENSRRAHDSVSSQTSVSSLVNKSSAYANHQGSSSHGNVPFSYTGRGGGGSLERTRKRTPLQPNHVHQSSDTSPHSTGVPPHRTIAPPTNSPNRLLPTRDITRSSPLRDKISPFSRDLKPVPRESNNNIDFKPNANFGRTDTKTADSKPLVNGRLLTNGASIRTDTVTDEESRKKTELLKLLNAQQDKLDKQDSNIKNLESRISSIEHFDHDATDVNNAMSEILRLERFDRDMDNEIQELELVAWDEKLELEMEKERRLHVEMEALNAKLGSYKGDLNKVDWNLRDLNNELSKRKDSLSEQEKRDKAQEFKVLTEISDLQKQINQHLVKHESCQSSIDNLQGDVKRLESEILDRKTQIAHLEKDLKTNNMESFTKTPTDWRGSQEGRSLFNRVSPSRPGSARRLESPQRLKEAVPSSKNPQGLWV